MVFFFKKNLFYNDYKWTEYSNKDAHVHGKPDDTVFNRKEGYEVLYLINKMMELWDYRLSDSGVKIEKLIHDQLPSEIKTQADVVQWVQQNLRQSVTNKT